MTLCVSDWFLRASAAVVEVVAAMYWVMERR
jgi:hypothetical protein